NTIPMTLRTMTSLDPLEPVIDEVSTGESGIAPITPGSFWDDAFVYGLIRASAGPFEVDALTIYNPSGGPTRLNATGTSVVRFSPLVDETAALNMVFTGVSQVQWTEGSVRLDDLTTGEILLEYGYAQQSPVGPGPIPWDSSWDYYAQADFTVLQSLSAS